MRSLAIEAVVRAAASGLIAVTSLATPAHAQQEIWAAHGQATPTFGNDWFGHAVVAIGDVDGDAVSDVVVGCPYEDRTKSGRKDGAIYVMSGRSGAEVRSHVGALRETLGLSVVGGGDFDGDGIADYAAMGRYDWDDVHAWSGATGALLFSVSAAAGSGEDFSGPLGVMPDLNGDGCAELGVAGWVVVGSSLVHRLFLHSGKTGFRVAEYLGGAVALSSVHSACAIADLNGDQIGEFAVGYGINPGRVDVVDGATRAWIATLDGETGIGERFGEHCGRVGDIDGDGIDEMVVADPEWGASQEGRVYVFAGATLTEIYRIDNPDIAGGPNFGRVAADGRFDANGDSWPDIASGSGGWTLTPSGFKYSVAAIFSGRNGRLLYRWKGEHFPVPGDEHLGWSLAVADLDGDGLGDPLAGAPFNGSVPKSLGVVHAFAGNDLFLQSNELVYLANDPIDLFTRGGFPGEWTLLAITAIDGTSTFDELVLTTLDGFGESTFSDVTPSGLAGMSFTVQAWATRTGRRGLASSSPVTVEFQ